MEKKRILLVSNGFYPEKSPRSYRATELAKEFSRQGHDLKVITKFRAFDYQDFLHSYPMEFKMWKKPLVSNFPEWKKKPFSFISRIVRRLLLLLLDFPGSIEMFQVKNILRAEENYDLLISFAVPFPVHWGVAWSRSGKHRIAEKWIADCGDPYMFARLETFKKPFYFKYFEKNFCRKCDALAVPFADMKSQFYPEFISKIEVIPQGLDFSAIKTKKTPRAHNSPVLMFAGSVIPKKRDLNQLLNFLWKVNLDFLFIIYTNQHHHYEQHKEQLGKKLELRDYTDRLKLIYELSGADFLVNVDTVFDNQSNVEAIPSKLIDYALAGRPILNINSSELDEQKVLDFLNGDYTQKRNVDISNYDIRKVAQSFHALAQKK